MAPMQEFLERMKITLLHELSMRIVRIPSSWNTAKIYDALIADGLAEPIANVEPLQSGYSITDKGREILKASTVEPIFCDIGDDEIEAAFKSKAR